VQRWFLSYHSPDRSLADRLKAAIENKDASARVFFAPAHLRVGGSWTAQLAQEIAEANAFILLVGDHGLGDWQVYEYDEALDKRVKAPDFRICLILLEGQVAPGLPFLRRQHWIVTPDPTSEKDLARLLERTAESQNAPGNLWRYTSPYRGLAAMEEKDSEYFFGRTHETVEVLNTLVTAPNRIPVLIGNSGVGKSSLAQAGVLAALKREAWPGDADAQKDWPEAFADSRRWCFLTLRPGTEPVRSLVEAFLDTWELDRTSTAWPLQRADWVEALLSRGLTLRDLLDQTQRRCAELKRSVPLQFLLYVDQGEELYVRSSERERQCFSEILSGAVGELRLRAIMSLRADFFGELQKDEPLQQVSRKIEVPPLREAQLRDVVSRPAALLSARFETDHLGGDIAKRAAEESAKDAGALPLLSYLLDDMWQRMVERGDGVLRLPAQSIELGRVLVQRADAFLARNPNSSEQLRRIFTLMLATVREDGEPTRRRALRTEFSDEEWRLVSELADHPNRLVITATPEASETYAEVAHEAIFRRWDKLREWIAAEREFLAWRSGLEVARRAWQETPEGSKQDALLMGAALAQAQSWLAKRAEDLLDEDCEFIRRSIERHKAALTRTRRIRSLAYILLLAMIIGLLGWINQAFVKSQWKWYAVTLPFMHSKIKPYVLVPTAEHLLKPKDAFRECVDKQGEDYCPAMVVVPAGSFLMGSPPTETGRNDNEGPQHVVKIAKYFAVSKFQLTFDEWDTCVDYGDCPSGISDSGFGRGQEPVIDVSWDDAQRYAAWLSKMTGKPYRLLTEAEYEYAERAGTETAYFWGSEVGAGNANCNACGTKWDNSDDAPVGSFTPNPFGLYDMQGNAWEWVEDCYHPNYDGAPTDGSGWSADCTDEHTHVERGGGKNAPPRMIRSAARLGVTADARRSSLGFRMARTLGK
jgi:formylglycine-generating enzyme required for sulfatase activity